MNYVRGAQARARRRKSAWNLLLLAGVLGSLALLTGIGLYAVDHLHRLVHPDESLATSSGPAVVVATVSVLLACIPLSLLVANLAVHMVPAARRVLDKEAESVKGTNYRASQHSLKKAALLVAIPCLVLATLGTLASWRG